MNIEVWTDGTSRPKLISKKNKGKDGPSAVAIIIKESKVAIYQQSFYVGVIDNNQAEYEAFIRAVKYALTLNIEHAKFHTDSKMVEKQMNKVYSVHSDAIIPYYHKAKELLQQLPSWEVILIPRAENYEADKMADECLKMWRTEHGV